MEEKVKINKEDYHKALKGTIVWLVINIIVVFIGYSAFKSIGESMDNSAMISNEIEKIEELADESKEYSNEVIVSIGDRLSKSYYEIKDNNEKTSGVIAKLKDIQIYIKSINTDDNNDIDKVYNDIQEIVNNLEELGSQSGVSSPNIVLAIFIPLMIPGSLIMLRMKVSELNNIKSNYGRDVQN